MDTLFLALIGQLNSAVFTLLLILAVAFFIVWKLSDLFSQFRHQKEKNAKLDTNLDSIKDSVASIRATTELLYQAHLSTIKSQSPLSLTDVGITIAKDLDMQEKINRHWEKLKPLFEGKKLENPYDVQTIALQFAPSCFEQVFSEDEKSQIKLYAYRNGKNLLEILPIIGILIRDKYITENHIST